MTTDPHGIITDVNKQMEALTGCTRDELIGAPFKDCFTDPARAEAGIKRVLVEKSVTDYELTARARDGKQTVVSYNATTFYDRNRKLQGVFAAARDVTERKRFELELQLAKAAAESASRTKSDFLASMSHEIRTPMNAIMGIADLLAKTELNEEQDRFVQIFRRSGDNLLNLINDILDLSKVEAGRMDMIEDAVDMVAAMDTACTLLRARAESGRVLLSATWNGPAPLLRADARMIRQILLNIISNAVKFTPPEGRVTVTGRRDADGAPVIEVADTGPGMTETELSVALAPFGQLRTLTPPAESGSGLGLPLAKSLTELHGGSLTLSSRPHAGTTVTIRFPADRVVVGP